MNLDPKIKVQLKKYLEKKIAEKKQEAQIISAYQLSNEEVNLVKKAFPNLHAYELSNIVDERIIAGLIIKFASKVIDLSIAAQLQNFKKLTYEIS